MVGHRTAVFVGMCAALGCAEPQAGLIRQHLGGLPPADTGGREVFHTEDYSGSPALKIYLAGQDALASTDPDGAAVVLDDLYVLDASHAWLYDGIMYTGGGLERACTPVATVDTAATSGWSCLSVDDTSGLGNTIGILTGDSYSEFLGTATVDPSNTTATSLCIYGTKSFAVPVNAQAIDIFPLAKTFNVYSSGIIVDSVLFDGGNDCNGYTHAWTQNNTLAIRGDAIVRNCQFTDTPSENLTICGGTFEGNTATGLQGSFVHKSCGTDGPIDVLSGNSVDGVNLAGDSVMQHSEGAVTLSQYAGHIMMTGNDFSNGGEAVIGDANADAVQIVVVGDSYDTFAGELIEYSYTPDPTQYRFVGVTGP